MRSAKITLVCAVLCVVSWCELSNGKALHQLSFHKLVTSPAKRISRSPGTYVADEKGQRVIIITHEISKESVKFNKNSSGESNYFGSGILSSNNNGFAGNNPSNSFPTRFNTNSNRNLIAQSGASGNLIPNQSQGYLNQQNSFPGYNNPNFNQGYINQPSPISGNYNPNYNQGYINQPNNFPGIYNPNPNQGYINQPNNFPGNYNPNYNRGYNYQPGSFPSNYYPNNRYNYQQGSYFGNQGYRYPQSSSHSQPSGFGGPLFNKPGFVFYPSPEEERTQPNIAEPYGNSNNISIPSNRVKIPGALKLIELLKGLGIPFLQTPDVDTPTTPKVTAFTYAPTVSPISGTATFGGGYMDAIVQGGYQAKRVDPEKKD